MVIWNVVKLEYAPPSAGWKETTHMHEMLYDLSPTLTHEGNTDEKLLKKLATQIAQWTHFNSPVNFIRLL